MNRNKFTCLALAGLGTLVFAKGLTNQNPQRDASQLTPPTQRKFDFKEPKVQKGDIAVIETNLGTIKFEFILDKAPKHAANFEKLADAGFYDETKFHRVIPGFMIQGGDPNSRGSDRSRMGTGGPAWSVDAEFNDTKFERGIVGMARSSEPNSAGSQFFIMVNAYPSLNNQYTAFGKVTQGMDVVDKIVALPRDGRDNPNSENPAIVKSVKIVHPAAK